MIRNGLGHPKLKMIAVQIAVLKVAMFVLDYINHNVVIVIGVYKMKNSMMSGIAEKDCKYNWFI